MGVEKEVQTRAEPVQALESTEDLLGRKAEETEDDTAAPTLKKRKVMKKEPKESPWKTATPSNPGDEWQPQEWQPAPAKRRA